MPHRQSTKKMSRKLSVERLENRELFAVDLSFDIDRNGRVDSLDSLTVINAIHGVGTTDSRMDLNRDGNVNSKDVLTINDQINLSFAAAQSNKSGFSLMAAGGNGNGSGGGGNTKTSYQYWRAGSLSDAVPTLVSGGLGLMGGGTDVDRLFQWMGQKSYPLDGSGQINPAGTGGDFLVIRATGTDAYNPYIQSLPGLKMNSVSTLLIPDLASANDPNVEAIINQAEAIFIAGGDQADYFKFWNETRVENAVYNALNRNVPIGGTSAGLAVLGDYDFTASTGKTVYSADALLNPYDAAITLDGNNTTDGFLTPRDDSLAGASNARNLLGILSNTITDSHIRQRDRLGRLVTFMARLDADDLIKQNGTNTANVRGIGINEQTALLIEPSGSWTVVGNNSTSSTDLPRSVYFMQHSIATGSTTLQSPLLYQNTEVVRLDYSQAQGSVWNQSWYAFPATAPKYSVSATGKLLSRKVAELTSTSANGIYG